MPWFSSWVGGERKTRRKKRDGEEPARPLRVQRLVEPALLLLLRQEPLHGYGLIGGLQELGLENYPVDPSAIYRILRELEQAGAVTSTWDQDTTEGPPKRVYHIMERGEELLAAWVESLRETDRVLQHFLDVYDDQKRDHDEGMLRRLLRRFSNPERRANE